MKLKTALSRRSHYAIGVLVATLAAGTSVAQTDLPAKTDDFKPSSSNQPGREYPQVNSEGRVRARIAAPGGPQCPA